MTIEEARNLIAESEGKISEALTYLYDEVGIVPKGITCKIDDVTQFADSNPCFIVRARLVGMEL